MMSSGAKILLLPWKCQDFEHMHQTNHNTSTALMQSDKKCETWAILVQGHLLCSKRWYTSHTKSNLWFFLFTTTRVHNEMHQGFKCKPLMQWGGDQKGPRPQKD